MVLNPGESLEQDPPLPDEISDLAALQRIVTEAVGAIEDRLASKIDEVMQGINSKIEANEIITAELQAKAKTAFETLPQIMQDQIQTQLQTNLKGIIEQVSTQFEEKVKAMAGEAGASGGGMSFDKLLANSDKIIGVVNAFRAPTTDQAMMSEMNLIFRWHGLLSKLEKGGGSGEDITKAIADTFTTPKQE